MTSSWSLLWLVFMFFCLVPPLGYGWGYRGWGPPYPRYIQRRRSLLAAAGGAAGPFKHESWGRGGDFFWLASFLGLIWFAATWIWVVRALWWPVWPR